MSTKRLDHDLYRGTLDIVVLGLLSARPDHGYGLIERMREQSGGDLEISEGAVYPLLHRLEKRGFIRSEWTFSEQNRRSKQYTITDQGLVALRDRAEQWRTLNSVIGKMLDGFQPSWPQSSIGVVAG